MSGHVAEVGAILEETRGENAAQGMGMMSFGMPGALPGHRDELLHGSCSQVRSLLPPGEQPASRPEPLPVNPECLQSDPRQNRGPILLTFPLMHIDETP